MNKFGWTSLILASTLSLGSASSVAIIRQTAGQDIKHAGTETKDAAKDTGHGIAKGTKVVAHKTASGTKTAAKKTESGTKTVAHKTASGTKTAVHKTGEGIEKTGDKIEGKPTPQ